MKKCEECLHSRPIVSENDIHSACCLSQKKAVECMIGKKDYFAIAKKVDSKAIKE